ncbi:hypothetical protein GCM10029978_090820 [Actinoallomurus acanthiterrae]
MPNAYPQDICDKPVRSPTDGADDSQDTRRVEVHTDAQRRDNVRRSEHFPRTEFILWASPTSTTPISSRVLPMAIRLSGS